MKIIRLSFKDRENGWNIRNLYFNRLTLLVGASGVGKTQILNAINSLVQIGKGRSAGIPEWDLEFEVNNLTYRWEGAFTTEKNYADMTADFQEPAAPIEYERLCRTGESEEQLIERTSQELIFKGKPTVKLEANKSAIALLKEEPDIMPIYTGITHIYSLRPFVESGFQVQFLKIENIPPIRSLDELRPYTGLSPLEKLYLLYKNQLHEYNDIVEQFTDIFPFVEDMDFTIKNLFGKFQYPILKIRERNVDKWIPQDRISSGMLRTLIHCIVVTLAEKGDVILIDEFENGLGVNCIEEVADMIINPEQDLQFIITSHHPYVINSIDYKWWKIVTRKGCDISVYTAESLRIGTHSKHDAFLQLVQSPAYQTGISYESVYHC